MQYLCLFVTKQTRHDRLDVHRIVGTLNSLQFWTTAVHPLRIVLNYIVVGLCRHLPSLRAKSWLLRRIGVTVGEGVSWGLESTPDPFFPEQITVADHAIIGYDVTLLGHEFLQNEYRLGEVRIGEHAMIGAGAIILPGVVVGENASVAANSLVDEDVPPGAMVSGVPATVTPRETTEPEEQGRK